MHQNTETWAHPPILEFMQTTWGSWGSLYILDLFVNFWPSKSLAIQSWDPHNLPDAPQLLCLTPFLWELQILSRSLQGNISSSYKMNAWHTQAAFMDNVNVRCPPTQYETTVQDVIILTHFCRSLFTVHSWFLAPCLQPSKLWLRGINTLRSSRKHRDPLVLFGSIVMM